MSMATTARVAAGVVLALAALALQARGEDPYLFFEWKVTYGAKTLLGAPQKVILINGEFPGPRINCSSNNNIVINVFNQLDQPLLFTWSVLHCSWPGQIEIDSPAADMT